MAAERDNPDVEFVVLDYDCPSGTGDWVMRTFAAEINSGRLRYARHEPAPYFKMAHAKNMAHRVATGDILCNLDADNFIAPNFSRWLVDRFSLDPQIFIFSRAVTLSRDFEQKIIWRLLGIKLPTHGLAGRIAISRRAFAELGGYDESYSAHGGDDLDFGLRARDLGLKAIRFPRNRWGSVIAHSDETRLAALSPADQAVSKQQLTVNTSRVVKLATDFIKDAKRISRRSVARVNDGNVGCGMIRMNFDDQFRAIPPLLPETMM